MARRRNPTRAQWGVLLGGGFVGLGLLAYGTYLAVRKRPPPQLSDLGLATP